MYEAEYKRVLIISHNCLSKTGSNGRTLGNYLIGWPKSKLAQLYIHPENPDFDICDRFFCISDHDVMVSILNRTEAGHAVIQSQYHDAHQTEPPKKKKRHKNSLTFLLREVAWNSRLWNMSGLQRWLYDFLPEVILFQAGDAGFLFQLTTHIAKHYSIPIILYNTEGYYFKKVSYLQENYITNFFYPVLHHYFCRQYRKLMNKTKLSIYNCDMLESDYKMAFQHNSVVVMNSSVFTTRDFVVSDNKKHHIVYAGSVGLGRYKSIIAVAAAAHKIDPDLWIDVYSNIDDPLIRQQLEQSNGIRLHGFVSYCELCDILAQAKYLLHIENFEPFYCEDLKYAFSTKIADSLATGNCLIVYAPSGIAVSRYLTGRDAAVLIAEEDELFPKLQILFNDHSMYERMGRNGRKLALQNHSIDQNRVRFQSYISEATGNENFAG